MGFALGFFQAIRGIHLLSDEPGRAPPLDPLSGELQGGAGLSQAATWRQMVGTRGLDPIPSRLSQEQETFFLNLEP